MHLVFLWRNNHFGICVFHVVYVFSQYNCCPSDDIAVVCSNWQVSAHWTLFKALSHTYISNTRHQQLHSQSDTKRPPLKWTVCLVNAIENRDWFAHWRSDSWEENNVLLRWCIFNVFKLFTSFLTSWFSVLIS